MVVYCMARDSVHHHLRNKCHDVVHAHFVIIKLLQAYGSRHRVKAFLLVLFVASIPWLKCTTRRDYIMVETQENDRVRLRNVMSNELDMFPMIFHNLRNEGIIGFHGKGLIVNDNSNNEKLVKYYSSYIIDGKKIDSISYSNLERKQLDIKQNYDFAFTHEGVELIDKVLKVEGIIVVQNKGITRASESFQKPTNYEIVYQKQFEPRADVTIIAMKKTRMVGDDKSNTIPHRRLMFEQKKAEAIKHLENVLLEPPRTISGRSKMYSKKTRYLPDLMDDSLEDYPRLVFIDVNGDIGWFTKNYPTRNKNFEIYQIETTIPDLNVIDGEPKDSMMETEITNWLRQNVKKGEYVVMKAEADVVEELINNKAMELVDELFLECKYQSIKCKKCRRPYWKCLALYGLLKDAGVAVHQWWG